MSKGRAENDLSSKKYFSRRSVNQGEDFEANICDKWNFQIQQNLSKWRREIAFQKFSKSNLGLKEVAAATTPQIYEILKSAGKIFKNRKSWQNLLVYLFLFFQPWSEVNDPMWEDMWYLNRSDS